LAVFSFHLPLVVAASTFVQLVSLSNVWQIMVSFSAISTLFLWAVWLENIPHPAVPTAAAPLVPSCVRQVLQFGFHDRHEVNRGGAGCEP
jgi:hypothetical protein